MNYFFILLYVVSATLIIASIDYYLFSYLNGKKYKWYAFIPATAIEVICFFAGMIIQSLYGILK